MGDARHADGPQHRRSSPLLVLFSGQVRSQTASTGALTWLVLDPSGGCFAWSCPRFYQPGNWRN